MVILEDGIGIVFLSNTTSNTTHGCDKSDNTAFKCYIIYIQRASIMFIYLYSWLCESCLIMEVILEHDGLELSQDGLQLPNMHKARSSRGARE